MLGSLRKFLVDTCGLIEAAKPLAFEIALLVLFVIAAYRLILHELAR